MTAAAAYCTEIWAKRYFWMSLVKVDLRRRYRRSWLGIGWSLMHPVAMSAVICLVFSQMFGESLLTYAPYVLSGLAFWNFLTGVVTDGCQCFYHGENYIRQQPAPLAIYPLRATLGMAIHLFIGMTMVLAAVWLTQGPKNILVLWSVLPAIVLVFALAWAVAVVLGVVNVFLPDTQHMMQVGMQVMFYVTPVFTTTKLLEEHKLTWLARWNPLAACLELFRAPILDGRLAGAEVWGLALATTCVAAAAAVFTLTKVEKRLIFCL